MTTDLIRQNFCGLDYYDPASVRDVRKEQYWQMTARIMQVNKILPDPCEIAAAKVVFKGLDDAQQHDLLHQQRRYLGTRINAPIQPLTDMRLAELYRGQSPLKWPVVRAMANTVNTGDDPVIDRRRDTATSHGNPHIAGIFAQGERVYLPMEPFLDGDTEHADEMVVLSRHPYDLMRMSTRRRNWTSCMDADLPAEQCNFVPHVARDIAAGTLVAYAVKTGMANGVDTHADWNINDPVTRCLFKPSHADDGTVIYQRDRLYGQRNLPFYRAVNAINKEWLCREGVADIVYNVDDTLYNEALQTRLRFTPADCAAHPVTSGHAATLFAENHAGGVPDTATMANRRKLERQGI